MKKSALTLIVCLFIFQKIYAQCPPVALVISGTQNVCAGASATYSLKTDFPANYIWSISGGGFMNGPNVGPSARVMWTTPGTYQVNVSLLSGCSTVYTYPVTVVSSASLPGMPIISGPGVACVGSSSIYSVPALPAHTVQWSIALIGPPMPIPPGSPSPQPVLVPNGNEVNITWPAVFQPAPYQLYATYNNGSCSGMEGIRPIQLTAGTTPPVISTTSSKACLNQVQMFTAYGDPLDAFTWSISDGGTLSATTGSQVSITWTLPGAHTVTLSAVNPCSGTQRTATNTIDVGPAKLQTPVLPSSPGTVRCVSTQYRYSVSPVPAATTYKWLFAGPTNLSYTTSLPEVDVTFGSAGSYTLSVMATNGYCDSDASPLLPITVTGTPVIAILGTPVNIACVGMNATLQVTNLPGHTYNWSVADGIITGAPNTNVISVRWNTLGSKTVSVVSISPCGTPSAPVTMFINVRPATIYLADITGVTQVCSARYFYNTSADPNVTSLSWTLSGGGTLFVPPPPPPPFIPPLPPGVPPPMLPVFLPTYISVEWTTPGTYTLQATARNACDMTIVKTITVTVTAGTKPVATITGPASVCLQSEPVSTYSAPSQAGVSYDWFATGNQTVTPTGPNTAQVTWSAAQTYQVSVQPYTSSCYGEKTTTSTVVGTLTSAGILSTSTPEICNYGYALLSVTESTGTPQYYLRSKTDNGPWSDWQGTSYNPAYGLYLPASTGTVTTYEIQVKFVSGSCAPSVTNIVTVNVYSPSVAGSLSPLPSGSCSDVPLTLSLSGQRGAIREWLVYNSNAGSYIPFSTSTTSSVSYTPSNTLTGDANFYFYTNVQNGNCAMASTNYVSTTVRPKVNMTVPNTTICSGNATSIPITSTVPGTTFSWVVKAATNVTGAAAGSGTSINQTLTCGPATTSNGSVVYTVTPTYNGCTGAPKDITATVIARAAPTITTGPATSCIGATAVNYTTQSGMTAYNWTISAGGTITSGQGTNSVFVTWNTAGAQFVKVSYTRSGCPALAPGNMNVTVQNLPAPSIATNFAECTGSTTAVYTTETGMTNYSWTITSGGIITSGATTNTINVTWNTSGAQVITVNYKNTSGCAALTPVSRPVTVKPLPVITASGQSICSGQTTSVSLSATLPSTFSWVVKSMNNISGAASGSGSSINQTLNNVNATLPGTVVYTVTAVADGCNGTPLDVTVTVNPFPPAVVTPGGATTFCSGGAVTLNAASGFSNYQWKQNGSPISGATSFAYSASASGNYSVTLSNTYGCSITSGSVAVTVNPLPPATITAGGSTTFCAGGSVNLSAPAGMSGYQWLKDGAQVSGATASSFTATVAGNYTVTTVNAAGCSQTSTAATGVIVNPKPAATISSNGTATCQGNSVVLTASGGSSYQWLLNGGVMGGATGSSYGANATGSYSVIAYSAAGCSSASLPVPVTINPLPGVSITVNGSTSFCQGSSVMLTANAPTATGYQWRLNGGDIPGATSSNFGVSAGGAYAVVISDAKGCSATSSAVSMSVNPIPPATITPSGATDFCSSKSSVTLYAPVGSYTYQWKNYGVPVGTNSYSLTTSTYGNYTVTVTGTGGCSKESAPIQVNAMGDPIVTLIADGPTSICSGGSVPMHTTWTEIAAYYQWKVNGYNVGSRQMSQSSYTATAPGSYTVLLTSTWGCTYETNPVTVSSLSPDAYISSSGDLCTTGIVTLTASTGSSYRWSNGSTAKSINVRLAGSYSVTVKYSTGCSSVASIYVGSGNPPPSAISMSGLQAQYIIPPGPCGTQFTSVTKSKTSAAAREKESGELLVSSIDEVTAFPNPATSEVTIAIPESTETDLLVTLFSQVGVAVQQAVIKKGSSHTKLDVTTLPGGTYVVQIKTPEGIVIRKLLVMH